VASTKAFITQLSMLLALALYTAQQAQLITPDLQEWLRLPSIIERLLQQLDPVIQKLAKKFQYKNHALFLGRNTEYPIAIEGALKLKELSYIHAEAYPAGELKHGPLALVDEEMPVIVLAADNSVLDKVKSNIQEVKARGGDILIFTNLASTWPTETVVQLPATSALLAPLIFTVPLQLLAYHVAVLKGTDVDQPRNLAKSVTVE
jgi:glucosamine--fructose-6-phosphate aminotransferase (isomerizing)